MESIFHEKQEGYLCAQHCLNALLQGPYFNAVDLANFGHQMDEEERIRMAESGVDSEDYKLFLEQPSGNMDDSGYFSVQVISSALKVWGLELIPYNSTEPTALLAQHDPSRMKAYICNYRGHWFTIRKIGNQWFNLNSMLSGPQLISNTYLAMYLAQLIQEGYSIFIVNGTFPQCPAEDVLLKNPVVATTQRNEKLDSKTQDYRIGTKAEDDVMKAALAMSEIEIPQSSCAARDPSFPHQPEISTDKPRERIVPIRVEGLGEEEEEEVTDEEDEDDNMQLARALELSLQDCRNDTDKTLKLRLDLTDGKTLTHLTNSAEDADEDDELRKALQLSLECVTAPPTPDPEDLRWRRMNHFGIYTNRTPSSETPANLNT
ncbi:PREDICTED: ataxin-3-like isoform X1 [Dinoponera quadriceps]|uniref:ubiquitinyl hydrolase 1 n=2 Tax=Dinoponera quadriceps TaxID=609295 RepID=A0A6P3Y7P3_DINQU|nr:PREDICTED: ataxin-3-like isoform X1 [Dinoponera quadriceps]XP_014487046.1 PREDICTED: ataxin-3-like isoform X1 [Dinoponera quadriceps]